MAPKRTSCVAEVVQKSRHADWTQARL
jgi:hypothetical protein